MCARARVCVVFTATFHSLLRVPVESIMVLVLAVGCSIDTRKRLTENILLAGGNTLFDGLPEMMCVTYTALCLLCAFSLP